METPQEQNGSGQMAQQEPVRLPLDVKTVQMLIQTMAYQEQRMDRLERRLDELQTRFNLWNSSYKNFMQTMEAYFAQQAAAQKAAQKADPKPQAKKAS